jgi:hypothetical protein
VREAGQDEPIDGDEAMKKALVLALVSLGVLCDRAMSLPAGYQAVAYIQSTGTQYINTGVVPGGAMAVEMDFTSTTVDSEVGLFGNSWNNNQYLLIVRGGAFMFFGAGNTFARARGQCNT